MTKINPLHRISGLIAESTSDKKVKKFSDSDQSFGRDRVEISSQARMIRQAEKVERDLASGELGRDARRVAEGWYVHGYLFQKET